MATDLIKRLRQHALPDPHDEREVLHAPLLSEAADALEQAALKLTALEAREKNVTLFSEQCNKTTVRALQKIAALEAEVAELKAKIKEYVHDTHNTEEINWCRGDQG